MKPLTTGLDISSRLAALKPAIPENFGNFLADPGLPPDAFPDWLVGAEGHISPEIHGLTVRSGELESLVEVGVVAGEELGSAA